MRKIHYLTLSMILLAGCTNNKEHSTIESSSTFDSSSTVAESSVESFSSVNETSSIEVENPVICINLSNGKTIRCELYPSIAPITVSHFLELVDCDYYNDTIFHRVIKDFMIQCGGWAFYDSTSIYPMTAPSSIVGEFENNGYVNDLKHTPGVLSMARSNDYNSATGQFFICVATDDWLDGNYAAFGKTIDEESLNNAIEISLAETTTIQYYFENFPIEPVSIISIEREEK